MVGAGIGIECGKAAFASGAKLLGSTGANFGSGETTIEFTGCRFTGTEGESCKIEKETIKTEPLKMELGYSSEKRSGPLVVVFKPAKTTFAVLHLIEERYEGCFYPNGEKNVGHARR